MDAQTAVPAGRRPDRFVDDPRAGACCRRLHQDVPVMAHQDAGVQQQDAGEGPQGAPVLQRWGVPACGLAERRLALSTRWLGPGVQGQERSDGLEHLRPVWRPQGAQAVLKVLRAVLEAPRVWPLEEPGREAWALAPREQPDVQELPPAWLRPVWQGLPARWREAWAPVALKGWQPEPRELSSQTEWPSAAEQQG